MPEFIDAHQELEGGVAAAIVFDYESDAVVTDVHHLPHALGHAVSASNHVHHGN